MKKVLKIIVIIVLLLAVIGTAVGLYFHFNPKNSSAKTEPSWTIVTKEYGTFYLVDIYNLPETGSERFRKSNICWRPNANLVGVKQDIYENNKDSHRFDKDISEFELVVIPDFNTDTNTQTNTLASSHINYKEKITGNLYKPWSSNYYSNIEMYILDGEIITYNKSYSNIPAEEKSFSIGLYDRKTNNAYLYIAEFVEKIDNEYYAIVSDTNYVFSNIAMFAAFPNFKI